MPADARWKRKLAEDQAWREHRRGAPPSWQAILFATEAEAEADISALAKAHRMTVAEMRKQLKTPDELRD